ncbi:MAG: hypothetical protein RMA76_11805 [Deltaproteobacteria bacterium]|jgi:hypothetical protein
MTASNLAAVHVDAGTHTSGVAPRRLAVIAKKRLQDLGVQSFIVNDLVRGRVTVDPMRMSSWPGAPIAALQEFVVQGHDRFWFTKPSPLRFIGPVVFYEMHRPADVLREIERRWAELVTRSAQFVEQARRYFPNIELDPTNWTLDFDVRDPFGVVNCRVRPYQGTIWVEVIGTDGQPLAPRPGGDRLIIQLPDEPAMYDEMTLRPVLEKARAGATPASRQEEAMVLELDIEHTSELSVDAPPNHRSASLSLDLELGAEYGDPPLDLELPELDEDDLQLDDQPEINKRAPRLKTRAIEVNVSTMQRLVRGIVRDVNHGGYFVEVDEPEGFGLGTTVVVSGLGPFAVRGTIAHRRMTDEGVLLGTGAGIGISLSEMAVPRIERGPAPVVVLTDTDTNTQRRARFAAIVAAGACTPLIVTDLAQALAAVRALPVRAVVLDQTFGEYGWRELADALRFAEVGAELLVVTSEAFERFPNGVRAVAPERLASHLHR